MRVGRRLVLYLAAAVASLSTGPSGYAQSGTLYQDEGNKLQKSNQMWNQSDVCGKESFRKFPDYTEEAALKRDAYMRDCLRKHHLPPRNDLVQRRRPGS